MGITPVFEQAAIQIDDVDPAKRLIHGRDKQGGKFMAGFTSVASSFQIPQQGEVWKIQRHGFYWQLTERLDLPHEHDLKAGLNPGDVHLRVPGTLHTDSNTIQTPGGAISATTRDNFKGDGATTTFTLSGTPSNEYSIMIWKAGVFMHPESDWTVSGSIITFASAPANNAKITVHYQRIGSEYRDLLAVISASDPSATTIP